MKLLKHFDKVYDLLNDDDKRLLLKLLVSKVEINYRDARTHDVEIKAITFKFDITGNDSTAYQKAIQMESSQLLTRIEYGNGDNNIFLEKSSDELIPYRPKGYEERIKQPKPHKVGIKEVIAYCKKKYGIAVYARMIRKVKQMLGMKFKKIRNICK